MLHHLVAASKYSLWKAAEHGVIFAARGISKKGSTLPQEAVSWKRFLPHSVQYV